MPRPLQPGLIYFSKDVDYYDDFKIMDLMNEYGPLGQTIFDVLLTMIYHEGYYLAVPIDKIAAKIVRIIGSRWVPKKEIVVQVIRFCADIGLIDKDLLSQDVITSVGIQERYAKATVRRQSYTKEYWLLDKNEIEKPLLNAPKTQVNVTETGVNVTETPVIVDSEYTKKSKVNESIYKYLCPENENEVFDTQAVIYLTLNDKTEYPVTMIQVDKWHSLYPAVDVDQELKKMKGWIDSNPTKRKTKSGIQRFINNWLSSAQDKGISNNNSPPANSPNKFNRFPQRQYSQADYCDLESKIMEKQREKV